MNKRLYIESIFLIFFGVLTSLSLPPFNYLILNFLTFSIFFLFLIKKFKKNQNKKIFFFYGWLFGFGYFFSSLYWISISLTFDQSFKFLIPLTIILIPSFLAIFYGMISYFFVILKPKKILSSFLLFSLIFAILEFIRGSILTGFPWNLIAYSFSNHLEVLSITSVIGTYGFNLFCISLFTSPALFIIKDTRKDVGIFVFFIITIILFYFYGISYKKNFNKLSEINYDYKVRAVGSNISLNRFDTNKDTASIIQDLIDVSNPKKDEKTIFVWPEGIISNISLGELIKYKPLFEKKFNENHLLVIGGNNLSVKDDSNFYFNSLSVYDNNLRLLNSYNKINLVPFGEFLPFENILSNIGLKSLTNNYQSFTKGDHRNIIEIKKKKILFKNFTSYLL